MDQTIRKFVARLRQVNLVSESQVRQLISRVDSAFEATEAAEFDADSLQPESAGEPLPEDPQQTLVFGNYVLLGQIGQGGMGIVFKARHRQMKRLVALKLLLPERMSDREGLRRFQREIEVASRLQHPNIATAYDAGESMGLLYFAMEYVEGSDLSTIVRQRGPLSVEDVVRVVLQAADGLAAAHREGIVHRDVKPGNLMLDPEGNVKILDLGLARVIRTTAPDGEAMTETEITTPVTIKGTADYMAPEQAFDVARVDHRCDIYSLGCTLYFLLTGRRLYAKDSVFDKLIAHREEPVPELTDAGGAALHGLDRVFRTMVAKSPDDRYQSMDAVAEALREMQPAGETTQVLLKRAGAAGPGGPSRRANGSPKRHEASWFRRFRPVAAACAVIAFGTAGWWAGVFDFGGGQSHSRQESPGLNGTAEGPKAAQEARFQPLAGWNMDGRVKAVAFSPEGDKVVCGGSERAEQRHDGAVEVRDADTGSLLGEFDRHQSVVQCLAISPDGRLVASAGGPGILKNPDKAEADFSIRLWELESGEERHRLDEHRNRVHAVAFSPDGRYLVSTSRDHRVLRFSVETGEQLHEYAGIQSEVFSLCFSPDGRRVLGTSWDVAYVWDLQTGEKLTEFVGHDGPVLDAVFGDDGQTVLTAGDDGTIRRWAVGTGEELRRYAGHEGRVSCLCLTNEGKWLLSCGQDGLIRLWDVGTGEELAAVKAHEKPVNSIAVAERDSLIVSGGEDGRARLWELASGTELSRRTEAPGPQP